MTLPGALYNGSGFGGDAFVKDLCPTKRCFTESTVKLCQECIENNYVLTEVLLFMFLALFIGFLIGYVAFPYIQDLTLFLQNKNKK